MLYKMVKKIEKRLLPLRRFEAYIICLFSDFVYNLKSHTYFSNEIYLHVFPQWKIIIYEWEAHIKTSIFTLNNDSWSIWNDQQKYSEVIHEWSNNQNIQPNFHVLIPYFQQNIYFSNISDWSNNDLDKINL